MNISFLKISDHEHELRVQRRDGSVESAVCETRSFLVHDMTHLAFEQEAKTQFGFWGSVASGKTLAEVSDRASIANLDATSEALRIEKAVVIFQGLTKGKSVESIVTAFNQQRSNFEWARPEWFEPEFVNRVQQRLTKLMGKWKATRFGEAMTIHWPE